MNATAGGRGGQILGRFPQHLEATRSDKLIVATVDALALDLDTLAAALAAVRRAHRLADADELADLWRLAALHGMTAAEFEITLGRARRARELLGLLGAAADENARTAAAEALIALWSVDAALPRLALFDDPARPGDALAASTRLTAQVGAALRQAVVDDRVRARVAETALIHAGGNGTVGALLRGAANVLDVDLGVVVHSADRYWHAARVRDRWALAHLEADADADGVERPVRLAPADELLGIEENPLWRDETDNTPREHGELFSHTRRGFERALLQVRITGEANRTVGPMFVNRDEGHGVGYAGTVGNGRQLVFGEDGRVRLDGADVTAQAYAWQGACFAGDDASADADFVFAGDGLARGAKPARFATVTPLAGLDREARYPSDGASLPVPGIGIGVTRFAFFVQEAHFASLDPPPRSVTPSNRAAVFDASVFAPPPLPRSAAARVALSWLEHRAFAVRLLIPPRFRGWRGDDPEGVLTLQAVARALERFRPLGVELRVEYIDARWTLGQGSLTSGIDDDPIEALRSGTELWPTPSVVPS